MPLSSADVHWALPATKLCCCFCCINSRSPSRSTGIAIYCQDCPTEPSIGETTNLFGEEIELKWMEGTYSTVWTYCRICSDSDKRRRVEWVQKVPRSSILLYGFELTKGKHLKKNTVIKLKELYSKLRDK